MACAAGRLDDVLPHHRVRVTIQVLVNTHEYRAGGDFADGGDGGWTVGGAAEPWCTCELDEFLDLVEDLKQTLLSCRYHPIPSNVVDFTNTHQDKKRYGVWRLSGAL